MITSQLSATAYLSVLNGNAFISLVIAGTQRTLAGAAVPTTGFHHVVGTWDGTNQRVYLDGVLGATSANFAGALTTGTSSLIGTFDKASLFFNGVIDDVAAYNYALSSTQVASHYNAALGKVF